MLKRMLVVAVLSGIVFSGRQSTAQDYSREMKKMLQNTFKVDYRNYQFYGVPISNFGVGFMYPAESTSKTFDVTTAGIYGDPNTWWVNISDADKAAALKAIFPSGESGTVSLTGKKTKSLSLSAVIPALFKIVSGNGSVDWNKTTTVTLTADSAENHRINWSELDDAVNSKHEIKESVARHVHAHDFVIAVGDIVLNGFNAHVAITKGTDAKVGAQLTQAASAFAKDSKLNFEYKSNSDGSLDLKAKIPVVVAVYIAVPPAGALRVAGQKQLKVVMTPELLQGLQQAEINNVKIPEN
jgi:hypothetical protein